jgi:sulfite exporter TauE/SafE
MLPLFITTFIASLLGSFHCAGMCGAFVALAVLPMPGQERKTPVPRYLANAAYNAGRLVTYTLLGGIAGLIGTATDTVAVGAGVSHGAAIVAGSTLVLFGVGRLLASLGVRVPTAALPQAWIRTVGRAHGLAVRMPPLYRALAIGLLTTLLPCGWLYAFAVTAAGTADPLLGAATMGAFWLGTLPMMASLGAGVRTLAGPLGARLPALTAAAMIVVGLTTVFERVAFPAACDTSMHTTQRVICNDR